MSPGPTAALILTGAPGSGKTSVLDALSAALEVDGVPFGAIETETFARGWPWLSAPDWMPQLAAVAELQKSAGRRLFLVVATTETAEELDAVTRAVRADRTLVVCLSVPAEMAAQRVADREPDSWPGKRALVEHAGWLAEQIPRLPGIDAIIDTAGRQSGEVAAEVRERLSGAGFLPD